MPISSNSYGSVAMVAALVRRYTVQGSFTDNTNPTTSIVEGWIDQVSGTMNVLLAEQGFSVPIVQAQAKLSIDAIVNEATADLCHAANSAGRFFTDQALARGVSPMRTIRGEMADWVQEHAEGLEAIGAPRNAAASGAIGSRNADESGDIVEPLFQRKAFGDHSRRWDG